MRDRTIVLCLDAFDDSLGSRLIAEGRLPGLERLRKRSARFALEHGAGGKDRYTGLTWEHFSSGRAPFSAKKWSVISFNPGTLRVRQSYATERPFLAGVDAKCVIFDVPYFDLQSMPNGIGVVGWGGHDVGVRPFSRPRGLMFEITDRFGPALEGGFLNTMVYPSAEKTARVGEALRQSVRKRAEIAEWLLAERAPDWDVAMIGFGETHDAIELFYHGIDPAHHLAGAESAGPARESLIGVYEEVSAQAERLTARFPDATFVMFTMHGMGENDTDLPTMLLLPELMYRMSFGTSLFESRADWRAAAVPVLRDGEDWNAVVAGAMRDARGSTLSSLLVGAARRAAVDGARRLLGQRLVRRLATAWPREKSFGVDWMPAMRYAPYWPGMDAFALPAYFDGRVRVNLAGREKCGRVPIGEYGAVLDRVEAALRACVDTRTGEPVVREITRSTLNDPMSLPDTQADLSILWNRSPVGFRHDVYGAIGPGPVRRTGGHSGGLGALYVRADRIEPGDYGVRSSFDVAPTILDLLGATARVAVDGRSVFGTVASAAVAPVVALEPELRAGVDESFLGGALT